MSNNTESYNREKLEKSRNVRNDVLIIILFVCVIVMGLSAIFIGGATAPGSVTAFYRVFIAALIFFPVFIFNRIKFSLNKSRNEPDGKGKLHKRETIFALLGGMCFGIDMACWSTGVKISGAALPTLLANTSVIWTALAGLLIFREKLKAFFWVGLGLAGMGVVLIFFSAFRTGVHKLDGYLLGVTAGFFYGVFFIFTQSARKKLATLDFFWISCSASAAVLFIFNLIFGYRLTGYPTSDLYIFLTVGLVSQIAVWMTLNFLQGHLPGSLISPALLGQPVMAALFGWIILGQGLSLVQIIGGGNCSDRNCRNLPFTIKKENSLIFLLIFN